MLSEYDPLFRLIDKVHFRRVKPFMIIYNLYGNKVLLINKKRLNTDSKRLIFINSASRKN